MTVPLYTPQILRLAASLPFDDRIAAPGAEVERRSRTCGSSVRVAVALDAAGRVAAVAVTAQACALGQASAALLREHAPGRAAAALEQARDALADWLAGTRADAPDWPGIDILAPARDHPGRHAAIRLPFEAAAEAARRAAAAASLSAVPEETR